ncbi:MAG: ABC transporter permease [Methanomassiliicoccales archaeon]|nr:ABC transporter permease [Methanomassiliicoccales archaeon]
MNRYLFRKMNRELVRIRYRAIGAGLLILLAVSMYVGIGTMVPSAQESLEQRVETLNLSDLVVRTSFTSDGLLEDLVGVDGVDTVEGRLNLASRIRAGDEVAATLIGLDPVSPPQVDVLEFKEGRWFDGPGEVVLEKGSADKAGIALGDSVSLLTDEGWTEMTVVGLVYSPEFIWLPINPQSINPVPGNMAVAYLPLPWLQDAFGLPSDAVNEFVFLLEDIRAETGIEAVLAGESVLFMLHQDEIYGYALIEEDLGQGDSMTGVIAGLILIVAFFVVYSSFARMVQEQRREIGILRALGYSRRSVLLSYVYLALIVGGISSLIGVAVSLPIGQALSDYYAQMTLNAPSVTVVLEPSYFIIGALFGPITAVMASIIAVWATVRLEPEQAIKGVGLVGKRTKARRKVPKPRKANYMLLYAIRKMVRQKGRTTLLVMAVAFSIVMGSMAFLMVASFENSIIATVERGERWDLMADLAYPVDRSTAESVGGPGIVQLVPVARLAVDWEGDGNGTTVAIGMDWGQDLHRFSLSQGSIPINMGQALVSYIFNKDTSVGVGDQLSIATPIGQTSVTVTGVTYDSIGGVFIDDSVAESLSLGQVYTGFYIEVQDGELLAVKSHILESPLVAEVQERESLESGMLDLMSSYNDILYIFGFISVLISAIAISNIVYVSVLERRVEYGQLRALGYQRKEVGRSVYLEVVLMVTLGSLLAAPLLYGVMEGTVESFRAFFPLYRTILYLEDWYGYLVIVGMTFLLGMLAAWPATRLISRLDVAKTVTGGRFG